MIIGGSGSGKTKALINLINEQNDINKIYFYTRDLSEPKYEYLIKKREDAGIKHLNNPNGFIECSSTMDELYGNIDDYNPTRKRKTLIVFDDMIADIMTNKKFEAIIKELFIRCRKLNTSLVFITQSYFSVPKNIRLNKHIIWSWKLTTEKNYKISQLIILQTLIIKTFWKFTENAQKNHITFWQ